LGGNKYVSFLQGEGTFLVVGEVRVREKRRKPRGKGAFLLSSRER